ncbi:hypothetical protein V4C53_16795 [Paraburkholderia azotifigens]|uniref:hypothetical protein n=1 Tax=Paraburkholderia azotifigens TaxID=2057004 RepID=UPI003178C0FE
MLGVYDSYADACSAQRALGEAGVARPDMAMYSMSASTPVEKGPRVYGPDGSDARHHRAVLDQLELLFARLFRPGEYPPEAEDYREFIRRGGTLVSVDATGMQADLVCDVMRRAGAADIGERANAWRNGQGAASSTASTPEPAIYGDLAPAHVAPAQVTPAHVPPSETAGDAADVTRLERRNTSEPSMVSGMQQVTTRADRDGSHAAMEQKQYARDVPDYGLARTSADVDADVRSRAVLRPDDGMSAAKAQPTSATGLVGDPVMGTPLDDDPEDDYRRDYDAHYASSGASYDEYRRAYTHGAALGQDERYRGQDWQRVEPSARENWESRYPESGWERFKIAVRHGWERVTSL